MTARKPPAAGKLTPADNEWIEARAIAELERLPTHAWENMTGLWRRMLPALSLSTQRRILTRVFGLAAKRGDPLSVKFVERFAPHAIRLLVVPEQPRSHIRNQQGLLKAAEYRAANPKASWRKLASAAGVSHSTVRQWEESPLFQSWVREFKARKRAGRGPASWSYRDHLWHRLWEPNKKRMREVRIAKLKANKRGEPTRAPVRR
jgi:hypothetical protein